MRAPAQMRCWCAGGILAYGAARYGRDVIPLSDEIVCTIATLLAASGAQLVGQRAGSAYAAKLSTITFLLVLLGSKDAPSKANTYRHGPSLLLAGSFAGQPYSVELSMMHDMLVCCWTSIADVHPYLADLSAAMTMPGSQTCFGAKTTRHKMRQQQRISAPIFCSELQQYKAARTSIFVWCCSL